MKEYDVFMALLTKGTRCLSEFLDSIIRLGKDNANVDWITAKEFKNYLEKNNGLLVGVKINKKDAKLIKRIIKENEDDSLNLSEEEFNDKYFGDKFFFDNLVLENSDDTVTMFIKESDVENFKKLINYLDREQFEHSIESVSHDIHMLSEKDWSDSNISEITLDNDHEYNIISDLLNINHIQYLCINHQNSNGVIYRKEDEDIVMNLIDKCSLLDDMTKGKIINERSKDINNREKTAESYKKSTSMSR